MTRATDETIALMLHPGPFTLEEQDKHGLLALVSDLRRELGQAKANAARWKVEIDENRRVHAHLVSTVRAAENVAHNADLRATAAVNDRREVEDLLRNAEQALSGEVEIEAEAAMRKAIGEYLDRRNPNRRG